MYSCVYVPLLLDAVGYLDPAAHDLWIQDVRSAAWWDALLARFHRDEVEIDEILAQALATDYFNTRLRGESLTHTALELLRLWRLDAERRFSTSISMQRALYIMLRVYQARDAYRPHILDDNYLPGELQEAFSVAFGNQELAVDVDRHVQRSRVEVNSSRPSRSLFPAQPTFLQPAWITLAELFLTE